MSDESEGWSERDAARLAELRRLGTLRDGTGADLMAERRRLEAAELVHKRYQAQQREKHPAGDFRPSPAPVLPAGPKPVKATGKGRTAPAPLPRSAGDLRPKPKPPAEPKRDRGGRL